MTDKRTGNFIVGATVRAVKWKTEPPQSRWTLATEVKFQVTQEVVDETKTEITGTFRLKLVEATYLLEFSAPGYNDHEETLSFVEVDEKLNEIHHDPIHLKVQLDMVIRGVLKGQVRVTNLKGLPIGGVALKFQATAGRSASLPTAANENGEFEISLQEGDYDVSIDDPESHYLKRNASLRVTVEPSKTSTINFPVEMRTVETAALGLTKKKGLVRRRGGQVNEGYCKLTRVDPSKPGNVESVTAAAAPITTRDINYGWFEYHDLAPGIYALSYYRPIGGKEYRKFSTYFTIDRSVLDTYREKPFPIGSADGRNALQVMWRSLDQTKDEVETITGMVKPVADILTGFGIKIP